jgi:oligopeptide transport system permease protein
MGSPFHRPSDDDGATLKLAFVAHVARLTRSSMVEALESMYVKVARARGLPERLVILRHALVAVETIFAYPGPRPHAGYR